MKRFSQIIVIVTSTWTLSCYGAEPEFFINYETCKSAVGYLVLSNESLKIMDGDPTIMACTRDANKISCSFEFINGQKGNKGNTVTYNILIDSPPHLHFSTPNGSEYVAVDTSQHAAVLMSRLIGEKYAGTKVCNGLYATSFEMKNIGK